MEQSVFLALPRRPGYVPKGEEPGHVQLVRPCRRGKFRAVVGRGSDLHYKFNSLWCHALNDEGTTTHWAMQHDDVEAPA